MWNSSDMKELMGKVVLALYVGPREEYLVFVTNQGTFVYETFGDCCSETWFADVDGIDNLLGEAVQNAEAQQVAEQQDARCRQDHDQFHGITLTTSRGYVDIIYRNSSNGYYGGHCYLSDEVKNLTECRAVLSDGRLDWARPLSDVKITDPVVQEAVNILRKD